MEWRRFLTPWNIAIIALLILLSLKGDFSQINIMKWLADKAVILPGIFIGLAFHEFGHAYASYKLGDVTPKLENRLTLNPLAHIDPLGFIALIFIGFGWGKPVAINTANYKNPRRDELIVALAGIFVNFILALLFAFIHRIYNMYAGYSTISQGMPGYISKIIFAIVLINIVLLIFNSLPIPPLDGFNAVTQIFNLKKYSWYYELSNKGFLILMIFVLFGAVDVVLRPLTEQALNLINNIANFW